MLKAIYFTIGIYESATLHLLQVFWEWENGNPLSFQLFTNLQYCSGKVYTYHHILEYFLFINNKFRNELQNAFYNLNETKTNTEGKLFPYKNKLKNCTLMFLDNLIEPYWIQVGCKDKMLLTIFCIQTNINFSDKNNIISNGNKRQSCDFYSIKKDKICYLFLWFNHSHVDSMIKNCNDNNGLMVHMVDSKAFRYIVEAIATTFPPLLSLINLKSNYILYLKYQKVNGSYKEFKSIVNASQVQGFHICQKWQQNTNAGDNLFQCKNGGYISYMYLCDGIPDCPQDTFDEDNQHCLKLKRAHFCHPVQYINFKRHCLMYDEWDNKMWVTNKTGMSNKTGRSDKLFQCYDGSFIPIALVDDLFGDCGPEAEDEPILAALLENGYHFACDHPSQLQCREGHSRCFTVADICKYKIDERGFLFPCRNGGHLENCKKFQCSSSYKCSRSYCIPWSYVCNGQWDCPEGYDEENPDICHQQNACKAMYKCKSTHSKCIHLNDICDDHYDCPFL